MTGYRVQLLAAALTMCVCQVIETTEIEANEKNMDIALHDIEPRAIGDCGGSFVNDSGQFSSPGYPNLYNNYENCIYYITVSIGYSVQLDFTLFHTEATHDAVKIYETYPSVNADAEYSGSTLPETYVSLGWTLTVQFTSDGSITYQGFLATYTAVTSNQENTLGDCGGSFTRDSGFFASPSYPSDYPDSQDCYYYIAVSEGSVVTLEFTMFETELCCDTVEIFDGNTVSSTSLGQYSGTWIVSQITSSGRSLVVHFHSDGSVTGRGFFATYSTGSGGSDGRNATSQYSVAVIAAGVPGTTVIIVTALIFVVCCCKQKSSISPSTNTTNRATARTQAEPRETAPLSTSLTGYYQPSAPANHNTYNNPTFGQDKGQGYPQPPGMGTAPR
ncbi:tolloid-like protein 2 [Ptychodera flava]|uniref:tolloid-like protein 2 n=1 Tax=Ptychodera flava TaxID=63121 RepID=UPI003969C7A6